MTNPRQPNPSSVNSPTAKGQSREGSAVAAPVRTAPFRTSDSGILLGQVITRFLVPLWVAAGAIFKLIERDPRLLPEPILKLAGTVAVGFMEERQSAWLADATLRTLVGIELMLVVAMIFAPRISRLAAAFTLSVFLAVLAVVMWNDFGRGGFDAVMKGSCGCLGGWSPPPPLMFGIDALLLMGVLLYPIRRAGTPAGSLRVQLSLTCGAILVFSLAALMPPKSMRIVVPANIDDGPQPQQTAHWPTAPEVAPMYFPQVGTWIGRRMSEIDLLQQMSPAPDLELLSGLSYVVVYRGDCGNCHELLEVHMSGTRADRTIALRIPEGDPAEDKPMPSDRFRRHALPGGPNYVLTTPVLAVVRDGIVRGASAGVDLEGALAILESVESEEVAAEPGQKPEGTTAPDLKPSAAPETDDSTRGGTAPATPAVERGRTPVVPAGAWPARPAVDDMYFPQFEAWIGKRLDTQPLALQIQRPVPANSGTWYVLFYRSDCEHCHQLMDIYLVGNAESSVIAVRIPDTDPDADLGMPLTDALLRVLPEGPTYVVQTPVLLKVTDGTVLAMATDPDDHESVMACLTAK